MTLREHPAVASVFGESRGVIEGLVKENKVMLFMKGNKMFPQCGFSNSAIQVNYLLLVCLVLFSLLLPLPLSTFFSSNVVRPLSLPYLSPAEKFTCFTPAT